MLFTIACIYVLTHTLLSYLTSFIFVLRRYNLIPIFLAIIFFFFYLLKGSRGSRWRPLALFLTVYLFTLAILVSLTQTLTPSIVDQDSAQLARIQDGFGSVVNSTTIIALQGDIRNASLLALDLSTKLQLSSESDLVVKLQEFTRDADETSQNLIILDTLFKRTVETMSETNVMKIRKHSGIASRDTYNMILVLLKPFGRAWSPWQISHETTAFRLFDFSASMAELFVEELVADSERSIRLLKRLKEELEVISKTLLQEQIEITQTEAETLITLWISLGGRCDQPDILEFARQAQTTTDPRTLGPRPPTQVLLLANRLVRIAKEIKGLKIRVAESVHDLPGCRSNFPIEARVEEIRRNIEEFRARQPL